MAISYFQICRKPYVGSSKRKGFSGVFVDKEASQSSTTPVVDGSKAGLGPLVQTNLNEAIGLAMGLWPLGKVQA